MRASLSLPTGIIGIDNILRQPKAMKSLFIFALMLSCFPLIAGEEPVPAEMEKWFEDDMADSTEDISEGELRFFTRAPEKPLLHSVNTLTINQESIRNGWVLLEQCYRNMDAVPDAEIVYHYREMRNLQVISSHNIASVRQKGQSLELKDIRQNAGLCVHAQVRIFYKADNSRYRLVNGPFHRKFLDGYYPYHVTLRIKYPSTQLEFLESTPVAQPGFEVSDSAGRIVIDSYFEGSLTIELVFRLQP